MQRSDQQIAVVGVAQRAEKFGFKIFRDLLAAGYRVHGINPRNGEILGETVYRSLSELPEIPDLVITVVPPEVTLEVVETAHQLGIKEIWMQPGSESESAIAKAKVYGIKLNHHACFMLSEGIW